MFSHGGNIYKESRRLGCRVDQILDASASLVPFPPSNALKKCLIKAIKGSELRDYPDVNYTELRDSIGAWHDLDPSMVLPGNGAAELFTWAARDASNVGISALPAPGFTDYLRALCCWKASFTQHALPLEWSEEFPQEFPLLPKANVIWITNPHNPTGQIWSKSSIAPLLNCYDLVICDEAFLPLIPNGESQSLLPLVKHCPNLVVIRSLTKLFGIAGLRLGYAVASPERVQRWSLWRDPWPVNGFALSAGITLLSDHLALKDWINKVQMWIVKEGAWFYKKLSHLPTITPLPSAANFFLIHGDISLLKLREQLAQKRILVRECSSFDELGEQWLRIGLQNRLGNRRILKAMHELTK